MNHRAFLQASAASAAVLGASAISCAHAGADAPDAPLDLPALLTVLRTPGLAAQGVVGGRPFLHVAGVREAGKPDPVLPTTWFSAASLAKPVFAMAVRRLVRDGKLEWRKPLQDYVPLGLTGAAATITAEHVLSQRDRSGPPSATTSRSCGNRSPTPPRIRRRYSVRNRLNGQIGWTLRWGVDSSLGSPAWFHWGDGPGVKNFTWWQPSSGDAPVIFTNGDHGASAYRVLMRKLLGADPLAPEWV